MSRIMGRRQGRREPARPRPLASTDRRLHRWTLMLLVFGAACGFCLPVAAASSATHAVLQPRSGSVGTVVQFHGALSSGDLKLVRHVRHPLMGLAGGPGPCVLSVDLEHKQLKLDRQTGRFHGTFAVGEKGTCEQGGSRHRVRPGTYNFYIACHSCALTPFEVQATSSSNELPFTGDHSHAELVAAGLMLASGSAFLRLGRKA